MSSKVDLEVTLFSIIVSFIQVDNSEKRAGAADDFEWNFPNTDCSSDWVFYIKHGSTIRVYRINMVTGIGTTSLDKFCIAFI